jgi:hypothetical protein
VTVFGAVLGAMSGNNNGQRMQQNADDGQALGSIISTVEGGIANVIGDDDIRKKYGAESDRCNKNFRIINRNRASLADYLSKKDGSQFLSSF